MPQQKLTIILVTLHTEKSKPEDIVNTELVQQVFDMQCVITVDPILGTPLYIPYGKGRSAVTD